MLSTALLLRPTWSTLMRSRSLQRAVTLGFRTPCGGLTEMPRFPWSKRCQYWSSSYVARVSSKRKWVSVTKVLACE